MDRATANLVVEEHVESDSLRRHLFAVETCMRAYALKEGEDEETWGIAGLLHDFDWEVCPTPESHPTFGAEILRARGFPEEIVRAVLSHGNHTGIARETMMEKALFACDELSGFVTAVALVRLERQDLDAAVVQFVPEPVVDLPAEGRVRRPDAVGLRLAAAQNGYMDQQSVGRAPGLDQRFERRLATAREQQVDVVVEDAPIADDDRRPSLRHEFVGDLGVENPRLRLQGRALVERQRTATRHLDHDIEVDVPAFQARGETVGEGRLADAVGADEGDLEWHWAAPDYSRLMGRERIPGNPCGAIRATREPVRAPVCGRTDGTRACCPPWERGRLARIRWRIESEG